MQFKEEKAEFSFHLKVITMYVTNKILILEIWKQTKLIFSSFEIVLYLCGMHAFLTNLTPLTNHVNLSNIQK